MTQQHDIIMSQQLTYVMKTCYNCGSDKTYMQKRYGKQGQLWLTVDWRKDKDGNIFCKNCYSKLIATYESRKEYYKNIANPRTHAKWSPRRFNYKGQVEYAEENPRTGVCSDCGKSVSKGEIKRTNLHHIKYDDDNPLGYTIELCVSCHGARHK